MPLRLKSLELHGYKTFASRTLFEFAEMVTAIVGPNGSGKSNITDGFRWVLGEQSYSQLRAKRTEDMIFSGSDGRSRAGMASATITFDNSEGWLPIDFSEVAVTRRAYRDGQNEYLINGQKVRLKEIAELLSPSGLAERTYTIISQGLVDVTLSLRTEERRRLFEEAAGIGLYRSRREEALRRLEVTKRNLDRVQDILAELKPRLNSLERQARRAQEFEAVRSDLQVLLRDWYGYHWHNSQRELTEAQKAVDSQESRLENSRQEQVELDKDVGTLRERIGAMRSELNTFHEILAGDHARRETINRNLAVSEERKRSLDTQKGTLQAESSKIDEELGRIQGQMEEAHVEMLRLNSELEEASSQAEAANQALLIHQSERGQLEATIRTVQEEHSTLNTQYGQMQAIQLESRKQVARLQKSIESTTEHLSIEEQEHRRTILEYQASLKASQEAGEILKNHEIELLEHRRLMEEEEAARNHSLEERSNLEAELASINTQLNVLDQAEASLTGYASGTKLLMQAAQQHRLLGARGTLNNHLEIPAELELAISAVLGDFIDAVLLENEPDQALDLLQEETGRGVLLPLKDLKPDGLLKLSSRQGKDVLGIASSLVQAPSELRSAVDLLLGRVLVVRDRKTARRILNGQPMGVRIVTLKGEVFHTSGPIMSVGARETDGGKTLFGRMRQRRELASKSDRLKKRLESVNQSLVELEAGLNAKQLESTDLEKVREDLFEEYQKCSEGVQQAKMAQEEVERRLSWIHEELKRIQSEIERNQVEDLDLSSQLMELEARLSHSRETLREHQVQLDELVLDDFQSQFSHWKTILAVVERAQNDARTLIEERRSNLVRIQQSQSILKERLEELEASQEELKVIRAQNLQEESELGEQIKAQNEQIEKIENEIQTLEQEQNQLQGNESKIRQSVSLAEHHFAQARINLAKRQESLQSLQRRIEDDFGLVDFEYVDQVSGPTPLPLEGLVEQLPMVNHLSPDLEETIKRQRTQLRRIGPVNPEAQGEYSEVRQRYDFLTEQMADLVEAEEDVRQVIKELDNLMETEFRRTFEAVNAEFQKIFGRLFGGGSSRLLLSDPDNVTNSGVDIEVRLPGRRTQNLALLSGGERSLTATSLIFALLRVSPTPFCVLDEVDAMLDEVNIGRFRELLHELSQNTQFVIVTHNRNTVQVADVIYGITMGQDSVSQVLSLKLDEVSQVME